MTTSVLSLRRHPTMETPCTSEDEWEWSKFGVWMELLGGWGEKGVEVVEGYGDSNCELCTPLVSCGEVSHSFLVLLFTESRLFIFNLNIDRVPTANPIPRPSTTLITSDVITLPGSAQIH